MSCLHKSYDKFESGAKMGSKYCCTALAALVMALLMALIIMLWIMVGQGAFRQRTFYNATVSDRRSVLATSRMEHVQFVADHKEDKNTGKQFIERTHLDDLGKYSDIEYVKPMKISPPPLHDHDILYDQLRNNHDHPPIRHHSGHFRRKTAEVWDPHPNYEIDAFGKTLVLELAHNNKFVSPNLHVIHVWKNYTQRVKHDPNTSSCYYSGHVRDDVNSNVAVSLCHGMTGYIKTSDGNYYIEPAEQFGDDTVSSILHRIKKVWNDESNDLDLDVDLCDPKSEDTAAIFDDDDFIPEEQHHMAKRSIEDYEMLDDASIESMPSKGGRKMLQQMHSSSPYFIETMIVADKKTAQYHKTDQDLIHYILTLMSHVAHLYKDATIGNPITLAVVDIMILKDGEFTSNTSQEMLKKFCEFQHKHTRRTHDVALLLTREVICKNASVQYCSTLGVAEVGSMCTLTSSCAVVRDKGLSTSYIIAHELGHVLSMPHDDDKKCLKYQNGVKANNIMSKMLHNDTKPWHWSACSKHFLTEFLSSPRSRCLLDVPKKDYITSDFPSSHLLPGESFEVSKQCELEFGPGATICSFMPYCGSLWCATEGEREGCRTQYMPWADGTSCGKGWWCHHGRCIAQDRNILSPVAGGWGGWQDWSECTRSCGGGIKVSKRECNNPVPINGGPYCTGGSVRYSSCNTFACESDFPDFREQQCAVFNGQTKGLPGLSRSVKWVPKYGTNNPDEYCKLYCRVKHSTAYYLLQEKVTDGTKCSINSFDICVNGICQKGGCDNELASDTALDECGVCGGDNSKCEVISGIHNISTHSGYNVVARIPKGSSNIRITQRGYGNTNKDDNYLALSDGLSPKVYVLNGNNEVSTYTKDIIFGGLTITYSGASEVMEHIVTPKNSKLKKDILVEVLSVGKLLPPDITFSYTISKDFAPRYDWTTYEEKWATCDSICSGYQHAVSVCMDLSQNIAVDSNYCRSTRMPKRIECNTHCKLIWILASKGHCSVQCGKGTRSISYNCVKQGIPDGDREIVDEKHCFNLPKLQVQETCVGSCELTRWKYDEWTLCTKTCGGGFQTRSAICVDKEQRQVDDGRCNIKDKNVEQRCNTKKCPVWLFGEWSPCSVTCGSGVRVRKHYCQIDNLVYKNKFCNMKELTRMSEVCVMEPCVPPEVKWETSEWSDCSSTCGEGLQKRFVSCKTIDDHRDVDDAYCVHLLRPNSTMLCYGYNCEILDYEENAISTTHNFNWRTGAWNECSKSCDGGIKSRMVVCQNDLGERREHMCMHHLRPSATAECATDACHHWRSNGWTKCDSNCEQRLNVVCEDSTGRSVDFNKCAPERKPSNVMKCKKCQKDGLNMAVFGGLGRRNYYDRRKIFKWKFDRWSPCSKSCGKGERRRVVSCIDATTNTTYVDGFCLHLKPKPKGVRMCQRHNCNFTWMEGQWSACSTTCGYGFKSRSVTCHKVLHGGFIFPTPHRLENYLEYCDTYNRPNTTISCIETNCYDEFKWTTEPWGACSQACGKRGRQIRRLSCVDRYGNEVRKSMCPKEFKPKRKRKCNEKRCLFENCKEVQSRQKTNDNKDYVISIRGKPVIVYCYKMDTRDPEEFITLKAGKENYAEFYDKRLKDLESCPYNGQRREDCDCSSVNDRSGKTLFWKVRLNITTLEIIPNDFTFSQQSKGIQISYGTAGDCYSRSENCPQGRFSIDLTDTSFRLSKTSRWISSGHKSIKYINTEDQRVTGSCGGYCATCEPDPEHGLKVEIT